MTYGVSPIYNVAAAIDAYQSINKQAIISVAKATRRLKMAFNYKWAEMLSHPDGINATVDFVNGLDAETAYRNILADTNHPLFSLAVRLGGKHRKLSNYPLRTGDDHARKCARNALRKRKLI